MIPPIGSKGKFKIDAPFNIKFKELGLYTVVGGDYLEELNSTGIDCEQEIYISYGLTTENYLLDMKNKVPVIKFKQDGGDSIYVPARYVLSAPNISGYLYAGRVLGVDLGNLPIAMNLDALFIDIENVVKRFTGNLPGIKSIKSSMSIQVDKADNTLFYERRKAALSTLTNPINLDRAGSVKYKDLVNKINGID